MKQSKLIYKITISILWLSVWQIAVSCMNRNLLIPLPTPVSTLAALFTLLCNRIFYTSLLCSVIRFLIGFTAAFLLATIFAILAVSLPLFEDFLSPVIALLRTVPVAALTIVVFLWIDRAYIPTLITFMMVLSIVYDAVVNGLKSRNKELLEMSEVFGITRFNTLTRIILPSLSAHLNSAFETGLGFAFKAGAAAEIICRTGKSLGNLLWEKKSIIDYDSVFAITLVIIIISTVLQKLSCYLFDKGAKHD